ncbi:MAG TPA: hypothetical protein VF913_18815 [Xanthobacteraceae bacterium]
MNETNDTIDDIAAALIDARAEGRADAFKEAIEIVRRWEAQFTRDGLCGESWEAYRYAAGEIVAALKEHKS